MAEPQRLSHVACKEDATRGQRGNCTYDWSKATARTPVAVPPALRDGMTRARIGPRPRNKLVLGDLASLMTGIVGHVYDQIRGACPAFSEA
jgi:hypothetical protein